jgi:hypothetical protein
MKLPSIQLMKITFGASFLLCLLSLAAFSCKKNNEQADKKSPTTLLTQKIWKAESTYVTVGGQTKYDQLASCVLDDTFLFSSDGTGIYDNGPSKCNEGEEQQTAFNWNFKENGTVISFVGGSGILDASGDNKIGQLDENTLELYEDVVEDGITYRVAVRLKH